MCVLHNLYSVCIYVHVCVCVCCIGYMCVWVVIRFYSVCTCVYSVCVCVGYIGSIVCACVHGVTGRVVSKFIRDVRLVSQPLGKRVSVTRADSGLEPETSVSQKVQWPWAQKDKVSNSVLLG